MGDSLFELRGSIYNAAPRWWDGENVAAAASHVPLDEQPARAEDQPADDHHQHRREE
jgi:hypothetical protein